MVMSSIGHDCDQACSRVGKKCSARLLKTINSCDRLRESVSHGLLRMGGVCKLGMVCKLGLPQPLLRAAA